MFFLKMTGTFAVGVFGLASLAVMLGGGEPSNDCERTLAWTGPTLKSGYTENDLSAWNERITERARDPEWRRCMAKVAPNFRLKP